MWKFKLAYSKQGLVVKFSGLMSSCIRAIQNCCWCVNHDGSNNLANSNNLQKLPALSKTKFLMSHYSHCLSVDATIMTSKGRDTLGNKSQRQVSVISRVMCTASEISRLFRLFRHSYLLHKIKTVWFCPTDPCDTILLHVTRGDLSH